jgi:NTP pyrophosphatase (non-canonical NTP hydrolase)
MTISELQAAIRKFRDERDWLQFHNAKDMAAALAIEAAELQEIFLWKKPEEVGAIAQEKRGKIEEEMADVAIYLLELADLLGIDLLKAASAKLRRNAEKYPVEKAKGSSAKHNEL